MSSLLYTNVTPVYPQSTPPSARYIDTMSNTLVTQQYTHNNTQQPYSADKYNILNENINDNISRDTQHRNKRKRTTLDNKCNNDSTTISNHAANNHQTNNTGRPLDKSLVSYRAALLQHIQSLTRITYQQAEKTFNKSILFNNNISCSNDHDNDNNDGTCNELSITDRLKFIDLYKQSLSTRCIKQLTYDSVIYQYIDCGQYIIIIPNWHTLREAIWSYLQKVNIKKAKRSVSTKKDLIELCLRSDIQYDFSDYVKEATSHGNCKSNDHTAAHSSNNNNNKSMTSKKKLMDNRELDLSDINTLLATPIHNNNNVVTNNHTIKSEQTINYTGATDHDNHIPSQRQQWATNYNAANLMFTAGMTPMKSNNDTDNTIHQQQQSTNVYAHCTPPHKSTSRTLSATQANALSHTPAFIPLQTPLHSLLSHHSPIHTYIQSNSEPLQLNPPLSSPINYSLNNTSTPPRIPSMNKHNNMTTQSINHITNNNNINCTPSHYLFNSSNNNTGNNTTNQLWSHLTASSYETNNIFSPFTTESPARRIAHDIDNESIRRFSITNVSTTQSPRQITNESNNV